MKKLIFVALISLLVLNSAFAVSKFIENTDYSVDFKKNSQEMAGVLHVNFNSLIPSTEEAEKIVKEYLKKYGPENNKNIIGSVWYKDSSENKMIKIKYSDSVASYVWINKTKKIVSFPEYVSFLKRERDAKRDKARAEARKKAEEATVTEQQAN